MTKEELQAIREMTDRATKGPWKQRNHYWVVGPDGGYICKTEYADGIAIRSRIENAAFMAYARNDIPKLLDHIANLDKVVEAAREYFRLHQPWAPGMCPSYQAIIKALAELDKGAE